MDKTDRCDACSAQALVRVKVSAGDLDFCRHHFLTNLDALMGVPGFVVDGYATEFLGELPITPARGLS